MPPRNKSSVEKPERKQPARAAKKRINYNNQQLSEAATRRAQAARAEETPVKTDKKPVKKPTVKDRTTKKPTTKADIRRPAVVVQTSFLSKSARRARKTNLTIKLLRRKILIL
jgi:hypothetical protein